MLVFALLAMAALVIDLGMANLAQAQMQAAVDPAALEGVRLRDFQDYRYQSDFDRRPRVGEYVRQVLDDDLHPTRPTIGTDVGYHPNLPADDEDRMRLGAGSSLRLTGGVGEANAHPLLEVPDPSVYNADEAYVDDPVLRRNWTRNLPAGDMVSGHYRPFDDHDEPADYLRPDFTAAEQAGPGLNTDTWDSLSFLVRLRRTRGNSPFDDVPNVSSRGPTLPYVWGLGSTIHRAPGSDYNPRTDGISVRATAIASARPATSVGPPPLDDPNDCTARTLSEYGRTVIPAPTAPADLVHALGVGVVECGPANEPEYVGIALSKAAWLSATGVMSLVVDPPPSPALLRSSAGGPVVGMFFERYGAPALDACFRSAAVQASSPPVVRGAYRLGEEVRTGDYQAIPEARWTIFPIYADITAPDGTPIPRVVGFGYGILSTTPTGLGVQVVQGFPGGPHDNPTGNPSSPAVHTIVATENASAAFSPLSPCGLTQAEWQQVFDQHFGVLGPTGLLTGGLVYRDGTNPNDVYDYASLRNYSYLAPALTR